MRDPDRINIVLEKLRQIWLCDSDVRLKATDTMDAKDFYQTKEVADTKWYVADLLLADGILAFARLRVFSDGQADVSFGGDEPVYGFSSKAQAHEYLLEDDYIAVDNLDEEDMKFSGSRFEISGVKKAVPNWSDLPSNEFKYLGKYYDFLE